MNRFQYRVRSLLPLAAAAAGIFWSSTALATLRPAVPLPDPGRVRIALPPGEGASPAAEGPGYYYLEPGDALTFPVTGSGSMRIRARSVQDREDASGHIRYSVVFGDLGTRRWKRISRPSQAGVLVGDARAAGTGRQRILGEEDVLNLEVPPGTDRVTLLLREGGADAIVRVFFGDGITQPNRKPAVRSGARLDGEVKLAFGGYDSNAYLSPKDANASVDKVFWPAAFSLRYRGRSSPGFRWQGEYGFAGEFYGESVLNSQDHRLRFKEAWTPEPGTWALEFRQGLEVQNETFVGRGDLEEFETSVGSDTVSLGDRFDNLEFSLEASPYWVLSSVNVLEFSLAYRYRDYRQDYGAYTDIYSLDQTRWEAEIGLLTRLGSGWRLKSSSDHQLKLYKEKPSRDQNGNIIYGEFSRLSRHRLRLDLARTVREGLELDAGVEGVVRVDHYDGYWNYSGFGVDAGIGWRWKPGHRIHAGVDYSDLAYDTATVAYVIGGPLRDKSDFRATLDARYRFDRRIEFELAFIYRDRGNNSPNFAFTQAQLIGGFSVRY